MNENDLEIIKPKGSERGLGVNMAVAGSVRKVKMGEDFNKEVTAQTLKKKLPIWTEYGKTNINRLAKIIAKKNARLRHYAHNKGYSFRSFGIEAMRSLFVFKPALVIGYGNSFHETVDLLKEIPRDKVTLIATDRPLRKLVEHGVIPDVIVNLDSGPQIRPFYDIPLTEKEKMGICGALAVTTHPAEVRWFHGPKYWYVPAITPWGNDISQQFSKATGLTLLPTAGNVGSTSILIAKICGAKPIFMIGMDFGREITDGEILATKDKLATSNEFTVDVPSKEKNGKILPARKFRTDPILYAYAFSTRKLLYYYDIDAVNISGGIMHGEYIKTKDPTPEDGGSSRDRMISFIEEIKAWEMPKPILEARENFAKGKLKLPLKCFMPQLNKELGPEAYGLATDRAGEGKEAVIQEAEA